MYDFAYHKPTSIADAVKILSADPDAKPVSGGHTLLPALKHRLNRPSALVDLSGIAELRGIRREGDTVKFVEEVEQRTFSGEVASRTRPGTLSWVSMPPGSSTCVVQLPARWFSAPLAATISTSSAAPASKAAPSASTVRSSARCHGRLRRASCAGQGRPAS
jgi:hypothetical protein